MTLLSKHISNLHARVRLTHAEVFMRRTLFFSADEKKADKPAAAEKPAEKPAAEKAEKPAEKAEKPAKEGGDKKGPPKGKLEQLASDLVIGG